MMSKTVFSVLLLFTIVSCVPQIHSRESNRKPQLFNIRKRNNTSTKPFIVRIRTPSSDPAGRVLPPDVPQDMVRESSILRIKPVIRFHHSDDKVHLAPMNQTKEAIGQLHHDLKSMSLSTMSDLLKKTGLDEDLLQVGTVTLFAPTDEAFSLGPRGLLESLLEEDGKGGDGLANRKLRNFLLQHAIRGHLYSEDIRNDLTAKSLHPSAAPLRFNVYEGGQMISVSGSQFLGSARLTGKDRILVQPIDKVLHPTAEGTILEKTRAFFPETYGLLIKAGLAEQLSSGTFTLLSPTDEAFSSLPNKAREMLLRNSTLLRKVMLNHVIPGTYFTTVLTNGYKLKSLAGPLSFTTRRGLILVNGVPIIKSDLPVTNGVIHALNRPLIPEELMEQCRCMPKYPLAPATLKPSPSPPLRSPGVHDRLKENTEHPNGFGIRLKALPARFPAFPHQQDVGDESSEPDQYEQKPAESSRSEPLESEDSESPVERLMQTPVELPDGRKLTFNTANQLFSQTLLINKIRHPGPRGVTVLLPSDSAFSKLTPEHLQKLRQDPDRLKRTLQWHILDESVNPQGLRNNAHVKTIGGDTLVVNLVPGGKQGFLIGGIPVLSVRRTPNGAVFAVDRVFDPSPETSVFAKSPSPTSASLQQGPDNDLSIWRNIIDGLPEVRRHLKSKDRAYTMFAPTNGAFRQLAPEDLERVLKDQELQKDLVWSHVILGAYYRSMMSPGMTLPSLGGSPLKFDLLPRGFVVNDVPSTRAAVVTSNGVIYIVDKLLVFPPPSASYRSLPAAEIPRKGATLEDIALENEATTFLKWIYASGLRDEIRNQRRCTIFLPTNHAVSQMSPTLRMATIGNPKILARFVRYHVCGGSFVKSMDGLGKDNLKIRTLLPGKDIRCNVYRNRTVVTASGCPVSKVIPLSGEADDDGMSIVIVNKTLSPPVGDLFLTASKSPMLRNFTKIIQVSGIEKELRNEDPLTIFAPIKCVFAKMPSDEYLRLLSDAEAAKDFVRRHIVRGCVFTSAMKGGLTLTTLAGTTLNIDVPPDGCVRVNGAKLKYGDMTANNGVLHVVSEAL